MSRKHPIVSVTGSSGAGTTTVKAAFEHIIFRENINAVFIDGDSYHRYDRLGMKEAVKAAEKKGKTISHFGPEGNILSELDALFDQYGRTGTGQRRFYLHNETEAEPYQQEPGTFTEWEPIPEGADLLFYEGLHGGLVTDTVNLAEKVDLMIGVVPIVNLEWIQKIHRDGKYRGHDATDVTKAILRRMHDYVHYITPQFSLTDINFQRVPTVDTSNPFQAHEIPTLDESFVVVRFKDPAKFDVDFPYLLSMLHDSFMSRRNTIVVPGGKMALAMEIITAPIIRNLVSMQ